MLNFSEMHVAGLISIQDISADQLEGLRHRVIESEHLLFSFSCFTLGENELDA